MGVPLLYLFTQTPVTLVVDSGGASGDNANFIINEKSDAIA